ncbi:HlyD family type I secretion periplasmic adaptor subunit [Sinorhizobium sp. RAC02]|uniref:HlyD family type I secretion periplasmic adaptor subunit n=1 Tax=Sinorhizobium sp. RAC02 TaxID=1842534 RepID=UPI000855B734|nr:HlyD family type I secretion periplasmic adaptor subunit [Sinorhizobium sp. RAC02]AOF88530.1 type I secretion membrane fusion, HlyD family protein [Sinorhizobium sp. RAC02]
MNRETGKMEKKWTNSGYAIAGYATVFVLLGGMGAWAALTRINGAVVSAGVIEVASNRQVVQHLTGGVVGEIRMKEGDTVKAGDVLMRLDDTFDRSELAVIEGQLFSLLGTEARLKAEQDDKTEITFDPDLLKAVATNPDAAEIVTGQKRLMTARAETRDKQAAQLQEKKAQIAKQNEGLQGRITALETQLKLISKELEAQNKLLAQSLTNASRVLALQREEAEIRGTISQARSNIAENTGRVAEIEIAILNIHSTVREEATTTLREVEAKVAELKERRNAKFETLSRMDITAPMSGVVLGLQVHALRSVIRPADPLLYIIPQEQNLVISTQISPTQIDQVHVGQVAHIRFGAFDHRNTPEIFGHVTKVAADVLADQRTGATYYKAEIKPDAGEMIKLGDKHVMPGMPVETFIQTAERSPLEYLVKPLADYFAKAFRER